MKLWSAILIYPQHNAGSPGSLYNFQGVPCFVTKRKTSRLIQAI